MSGAGVAAPEVQIAWLADRPQDLPKLAALFRREWADWYGADGPGDADADLRAYARRDRLPIGLVALADGEPCGVAALKAESIGTHPHLCPWIGGGMVEPRYRRRGIGARLSAALEDVARARGYRRLYAGTSTAHTLLRRNGWLLLEQVRYNGEAVSIYEKSLWSAATCQHSNTP